MIFHFSIAADNPKRTATMLAELWRGEALPFPMLGHGSWIAHAGDDRRSSIEVYPRDVALHPAERFGDLQPEQVSRHGPFHAAVATPLGIDEVEEIGRRYECKTRVCQRGPWFRVIEFWVDDCLMLEMLTPEMQQEYMTNVTVENWHSALSNVFKLTPEGEPMDGAEAA
ncbi:MAG: hypothetical protein ACTHJK_03905 [Sphingomicrobium sp.]